ncbi:MAG: hypothetical protein H0T46_13650 [Deltaproteobacteria bacterium]|nr:hypothetical protein [Deltaproteobacteria bacterium]
MKRSIVLVLVLAMAAPAAAERAGGGQGSGTVVDRREAVKKRIRALRAYTLTEELALDELTAAKLFPVLAKWDDVTDKLLVTRVDVTQRLRAAEQLRDPKALDKLINEAVANQKAFWDLEEKRLAELRKILSPAQTAKLLVVLPAFERKIQNQLKRAISRRGGAPGRAGRRNDLERDLENDADLDEEELSGPQAPRTGPAKQAAPPCDPFTSRDGCAKR